jgi:hypothetical protein
VLHGIEVGADRLGGNDGLTAASHGSGDHDGQDLAVGFEDFLDGDQRRLGVQGIEDRCCSRR